MRSTWYLVVAAFTAACSGARSHVDVSPAEVAFAAPQPARAEASAAPAPSEPEDTTPAVLTRALLRRVVDAGIGAFLSDVELSPVLDRGRFVGFRLDRARGLRRWNAAGVDLRAGDVVTRVNGSPIERPEQAQAVFWSLPEATELVAEVLRAGAPVTVRVPVVADPPAPVTAAR